MSRFEVHLMMLRPSMYAVYDTQRASYPAEFRGRRFERTPDQTVAQALADEMNADPDLWPLPGRETSQSSRRGASS